jgi:hypothetical protein
MLLQSEQQTADCPRIDDAAKDGAGDTNHHYSR